MAISAHLARVDEVSTYHRQECGVCALLTTLPVSEADALSTMLGDDRWTGAAIGAILQEEGYKVRAATVRRHRKGDCAREVRGVPVEAIMAERRAETAEAVAA